MLNFRKLAGFGVMLVDTVNPKNRVEWDAARGRKKIFYRLSEADKERMRKAAQIGVEIMFAAGARRVLLPSEEPIGPLASPHFHSLDQAKYCSELQFRPAQTTITSAHCQATIKMGEDREQTVINSRCEVHDIERLMVCDASSFSESCGANPMISIMTMARYQGRRIASELHRYGL
jgi:choline dehydrogenase-like flavoprotein